MHTAQEAWTGKVDAKASILLALEGGLLAAILAGYAQDGLLLHLQGWRRLSTWAGMLSLSAAILFAALAVKPSLGRTRHHRSDARDNLIYFGHLRHQDPNRVSARLRSLSAAEQTDMLGRQLVAMSRANWRKHRWVSASVISILLAVVAISVAVVWPT